MKTYLEDGERQPLSFARGCSGCLLILLVLIGGSCTVNAVWENFEARSNIPPELQPTLFVDVEICDRILGGYTYMARISPAAATRLQREGPEFLSTAGLSDIERNAAWRPVAGLKWDPDGPPSGLMCLRKWNIDGKSLPEHLFRRGGYMRSGHQRQGDYIVPSLGIIVGGFDPR